jgi:dihydroorotate dehydrogenase electron transfer subunit
VNIKALDVMWGPFLRRPFSLSGVSGDSIELLFNVIGSGTRLLASRAIGEKLDVLGPLGRPFGLDDSFSTAVMVAGGLGVAPFPFVEDALKAAGKESMLVLGARTAGQVYAGAIRNVSVATDDGTLGHHGTVVDLLERTLTEKKPERPKIFGCGPTPMLRALSAAAQRLEIPCEVSLEGDMACGIGICQGCPVETVGRERKYALVCTDGPTFDCKEVLI